MVKRVPIRKASLGKKRRTGKPSPLRSTKSAAQQKKALEALFKTYTRPRDDDEED
jgi:hypothetical protein